MGSSGRPATVGVMCSSPTNGGCSALVGVVDGLMSTVSSRQYGVEEHVGPVAEVAVFECLKRDEGMRGRTVTGRLLSLSALPEQAHRASETQVMRRAIPAFCPLSAGGGGLRVQPWFVVHAVLAEFSRLNASVARNCTSKCRKNGRRIDR
ncbi:hypothetical protein OH77DRAFT_1421445 [Trametes cingulata]|nr:hypothetical protein OH77DRAFT_1421445 [Trametes cingulata]